MHTVENLMGPGPGHRNSRIFYFSFDRSFISSLRISYSFSHIHPLFQLHPDAPPSTHPTDFFFKCTKRCLCFPRSILVRTSSVVHSSLALPYPGGTGWRRPAPGKRGPHRRVPNSCLSASGGDTGPAGSEAPRPGGPRERSPHAGSADAGWGRRGLPGPRCTPADRVRPQGISWSSLSPTATSPTGRSAYGS